MFIIYSVWWNDIFRIIKTNGTWKFQLKNLDKEIVNNLSNWKIMSDGHSLQGIYINCSVGYIFFRF